MKRSLFWLLIPVLLGALIAVFAVVVPAQAGKPVQALDDHHPRPGVEIYGVVESFPELLVGNWTIDGVVYTATSETHFSMDDSPFYVGACVEVRYNQDTYIAYSIEMNDTEKCNGDDEVREHFYGLIEQVPEGYTSTQDLPLHGTPGVSGTWVISGTAFVSTEETRLKTHHGPLEVGACASVKYRVVDGVNMADEIRSEKIFMCYRPVSFNQAYGYVVTFPDDLVGAWVISDTTGMSMTFMTTPSSDVRVHHYPLEVGACLKVKYFTDQGVNYAAYVKTSNPQQCEGHFIEFNPLSKLYATVDAMPPTTTITGTWVLAGVNFTATQETRIEEEEGPLEVGSCAEAKYDATNGAMLLRKLEGEEAEDCQAKDGSQRFKLYGVVELMPTGGYTGTWQVSGVSFSVTPSTTLESRFGDFAIGAYVKVYFTFDATTGERTAQLLKTHVAPGYGHWNYRGHFGGWDKDATGDKVILDGVSYLADPDIDAPTGIQKGDMVWMNVYQDADGTFVTQISLDQSLYLPLIQH
jgi:hypothetical protein